MRNFDHITSPCVSSRYLVNAMPLISSFRHPSIAPSALALAVIAACICTPAAGQITPDAGQTMRELQRPLEMPHSQVAPQLKVPQQVQTGTDSTVPIEVKSFVIEGNSQIAHEPLQALIADVRGQTLTLGALRTAVLRISTYYHAQGYIVARAFLPLQDIHDGVVRIQVVEGRLGGYTVDNQSLVSDQQVQRMLAGQGLEGKVIHTTRMDRTLLLMSDLPGIGTASGDLHPGAQVGTSDMQIRLPAEDRVSGQLSADNFGNRYTGRHRVHGSVDINSPMGWGDRLSVSSTISDENLLYGRVAYSLPLGTQGWRAGAALARSRYELGKEFEALDAHGTASSVSAQLSYPLVRTWGRNVWVGLNVEHRSLKDDASAASETTRRSANAVALDLYGDWTDNWVASTSYSSWRASLTHGDHQINSAQARVSDALGPHTEGSYSKLNLNFSRLQGITRSTSLYATVTGQFAFNNLDSSEQMVLGGRYGVRAYQQGEAVGDQGVLLNLELRQQLAPNWVGSVFYDYGRVKLRHTPFAQGKNHRSLDGYGLGLGYTAGDLSLNAYVAWRGNDAAVSAPDKRQRFGVSASWRF